MEYFLSGTRRVVVVGSEPSGTQGNAWTSASVSAGGVSPSVNKSGKSSVTAVGSADAATTVSLEVSLNGTDWYASGAQQVLGAAGAFHINLTTALPYVRVKSSGAATITATVVAL